MLLHDAHMEPQDPRLAHLQIVAQLMDRAFRVPGTRWRFGLDALLGLIPGLGDVVGSLIGTYSLLIARQLGAPPAVQGRMLLNLAIDAVVGFIPLAGDLFDFAFKANTRNVALLERWLAKPHATRRSSAWVLVVGIIVMLAILAVAGWLVAIFIGWLISLLHG